MASAAATAPGASGTIRSSGTGIPCAATRAFDSASDRVGTAGQVSRGVRGAGATARTHRCGLARGLRCAFGTSCGCRTHDERRTAASDGAVGPELVAQDPLEEL